MCQSGAYIHDNNIITAGSSSIRSRAAREKYYNNTVINYNIILCNTYGDKFNIMVKYYYNIVFPPDTDTRVRVQYYQI